MYLVQEKGPTKFIIEDVTKKKYNVEIGQQIKCTCGGGDTDHCVHSVSNKKIFLLMKIFCIEPDNPLIWQISYSDAEINSIIGNRFNSVNISRE